MPPAAPKLISSNPTHNATGVPLSLNIELVFNQNMFSGPGLVHLMDWETSISIDSIAGVDLSINAFDRTEILWPGVQIPPGRYYILADAGVLKSSSEDWIGIDDDMGLRFVSIGAPPFPTGETDLSRPFPDENAM